MINYIWAGMMLVSIIFGIATGRSAEVSAAIFTGVESAAELCMTLLPSMCLWGGLMQIADLSGITRVLSAMFSPAIRFIFPGLDPKSKAAGAICMNMSANLLGLGNAATPLGIEAMKQLKSQSAISDTASNHMIMFVVINTASLQLIPTTIAAMRLKAGSENPMEIMPAILLASFISLIFAVILTRVINSFSGSRNSQPAMDN